MSRLSIYQVTTENVVAATQTPTVAGPIKLVAPQVTFPGFATQLLFTFVGDWTATFYTINGINENGIETSDGPIRGGVNSGFNTVVYFKTVTSITFAGTPPLTGSLTVTDGSAAITDWCLVDINRNYCGISVQVELDPGQACTFSLQKTLLPRFYNGVDYGPPVTFPFASVNASTSNVFASESTPLTAVRCFFSRVAGNPTVIVCQQGI